MDENKGNGVIFSEQEALQVGAYISGLQGAKDDEKKKTKPTFGKPFCVTMCVFTNPIWNWPNFFISSTTQVKLLSWRSTV